MDLKTGRHQGLREPREPRFLLPSLETSPFAPAVPQHATCSCKRRKKQAYFSGDSEKEGEGDARLYFRGSLALFRFQTSFQNSFSLVPASPNMKPGHLNPHVNCKMLPLHPFRHRPFFRAKQHSLNNPMHHTSYFPSDT